MSAIEPLCSLIGINSFILSKVENFLLEAELFTQLCEELKILFRQQYKQYFRLMKFTIAKENTMLDINFAHFIINDILSTEEYTLEGIALYTDTHRDVVEEIFTTRNTNPSAIFLRRLIELHRVVRPILYQSIMKKIISAY